MTDTMSIFTMKRVLVKNHYSHSVPSGKSWYYFFDDAIVVFSIPANKNVSTWLTGLPNIVVELSRLWAPNGHEPNLLTRAISKAVKKLRVDAPKYEALVSYADPNVGHEGWVYRAASWVYLGRSEEGRYYRNSKGQVVSRRKFHSGKSFLKKAEILAMGYEQHNLPGKIRFARGLTRRTKSAIRLKFNILQS